jgi:general secretion pathway protein B
MSYILDALKRADTERERGAAPGLHTRHQVPESNPGTPRTKRNIGLALGGALLLVLVALFFWVTRAPDALPAASALPPPAPAPAPAPLPVPVPAPVPLPAPAVLAEAPKAKALPVPAAAAAKPLATPDAKPVGQTAVPAGAPASAPAPVPKPAPAAVPLLADLPQELRSQIPKIAITGSVYSNSPAQRLLLVNNLVLPQGSQVGPELTLEEILPRSSVFSFKGTHFRVMH